MGPRETESTHVAEETVNQMVEKYHQLQVWQRTQIKATKENKITRTPRQQITQLKWDIAMRREFAKEKM